MLDTTPAHLLLNQNYFNAGAILNLLPAAVYTCDALGKIVSYNKKAVELWGYEPDITDDSLRFCACNKVWTMDGAFIAPEQTPMAMALQTGASFRNIAALVGRPDGTTFYASVNIDPIRDEEGTVIGAINIFQDTTSLYEAEEALKASEARYRQLVQGLNTPLYLTDEQGHITLYNKAAEELWGRIPETGKDQWSGSCKILRTDGTDLPADESPMAICIREQRAIMGEEIIVVRPDGALRNVRSHSQPIFDPSGRLTGAINMLIDITGEKNIEEALRHSEARYRELAASLEKKVEEKSADLQKKNEELQRSEERYHKMVDEVEDYAIILLDKNGLICNWNKGAEKIKGYQEQEIIGKSFEVFYLEEDRKNRLPQQLIAEATLNGKAIHEGWRRKKNGDRFWGSIVITALRDEQNNVMGFTKVTRDLTEKKLTEEQLRDYSSQLEFQNKELEQFAYAASHDMKEPIRKIHLYNSFIAGNPANTLDAKSKEYLERSISSVRRMSNLIEDLLTYSKTTSSRESFRDLDLNNMVAMIIQEHQEELDEQMIRIEATTLPVIQAIPFQCKQLLDNLVNNAIKYRHPDRPGLIRIDSTLVSGAAIREQKADLNKNYYKLSVTDNGIGFEQAYTHKIFEVFQRLHNMPDAKGSGIGLAICKKIVQNHKGFISATGVPDEGARFDIFLPVEQSD